MGLIIDPNTTSLLVGVTKRPSVPIFYCDESGRSGTNYLDRDRIHVFAGWLIAERDHRWLIDRVERVRSLRPTTAELGASSLMRSRAGQELLSDFLLDALGAPVTILPISVVVDKRYFAGIKLATLFLNPATNPRVTRRHTPAGPNQARAEAEVLAGLSDPCIRSLIATIEEPSVRTVRSCIDRVASELHSRGHAGLARRLSGARLRAQKIAHGLSVSFENFDQFRGVRPALRVGMMVDFDAFHWCIDQLDRLLGGLGVHRAYVVADQPQGEMAFQELFITRKMARTWPHIGWLNFASKPLPGIEAADMLAGSLRRLFSGEVPPPGLDAAMDTLLFSCFSSPPKFQYFGFAASYRGFAIRSADFWRRRQAAREEVVRALRKRASNPSPT